MIDLESLFMIPIERVRAFPRIAARLQIMDLFLRQSLRVAITLDDTEGRETHTSRRDGKEEISFIYKPHEPISGVVNLIPTSAKKLEHTGIKLEIIGQIGNSPLHTFPERGKKSPATKYKTF